MILVRDDILNREPEQPVPYFSSALMPASTTTGSVVRPR